MSLKMKMCESWKQNNKFLGIDSTKTILTCDVCIKWKSKLPASNAFIMGSRNLKSSAVDEHTQSKLHKQALQLEEQDQARVENRRARVIQQKPPSDSGILQEINNMGRLSDKENKGLKKLFDIAYLVAFKARPYSDFSDLVEVEKLHGIRFLQSCTYENDMACKLFVHYASKSLYEKELKDKIKKANFITILADGATDAALIEKEVIYIFLLTETTLDHILLFLA